MKRPRDDALTAIEMLNEVREQINFLIETPRSIERNPKGARLPRDAFTTARCDAADE